VRSNGKKQATQQPLLKDPSEPREFVRNGLIWREAGRPYDYCGTMGRSTVKVDCAFCGHTFFAYQWSLSGSGKKCPNCGAVRSPLFSSIPLGAHCKLSAGRAKRCTTE